MTTRRNAGGEIGQEAAGVNHVFPHALAARMEMPFNLTGLKDGEVTKTLVQMDQDNTLEAQAMTTQMEQQGVPRENPPSRTMAKRLWDFRRMNPPGYTVSKNVDGIEEECRESTLNIALTF